MEMTAAVVKKRTNDLSAVVDPRQLGSVASACAGIGIIDGGVAAVAVKEAVFDEVAVDVLADDLARVDDVGCKGAVDGQGIVEGAETGVGVVAEAVVVAVAVLVRPDDLATAVDSRRCGTVDGDVQNLDDETVLEEKPMVYIIVIDVLPDDLA